LDASFDFRRTAAKRTVVPIVSARKHAVASNHFNKSFLMRSIRQFIEPRAAHADPGSCRHDRRLRDCAVSRPEPSRAPDIASAFPV